MPPQINGTNNSEIDQALREFEKKSSQNVAATSLPQVPATHIPGMIRFVMKLSGVSNERQAEYILLGFVVVALSLSLYLIFNGSGGKQDPRQKVYQEDLTPELRESMPPDILNKIPYRNAK